MPLKTDTDSKRSLAEAALKHNIQPSDHRAAPVSGGVLESEADRIHWAIFRVPALEMVKQRFVDATLRLNRRLDRTECKQYYAIIQNGGDLEALEIACRYRKMLPLLSLKFRLMIYMAETQPENQRYFVNENTHPVKGWWALFGGLIRTAYKFGKGVWLLKRIPHA